MPILRSSRIQDFLVFHEISQSEKNRPKFFLGKRAGAATTAAVWPKRLQGGAGRGRSGGRRADPRNPPPHEACLAFGRADAKPDGVRRHACHEAADADRRPHLVRKFKIWDGEFGWRGRKRRLPKTAKIGRKQVSTGFIGRRCAAFHTTT